MLYKASFFCDTDRMSGKNNRIDTQPVLIPYNTDKINRFIVSFFFKGANEGRFMGEIKTKILIKSMIGALISVGICLTLYAFGAYDEMIFDRPAVLAQFLGSMLMGALCMGGSVAYEIDSWSLGKATLVHYVATIGAFICASSLLHWFDGVVLLIAIICCTVAYFIIWLVNYLLWKKEIRTINSDLAEMKRKEEEDHL